MRRPHISYHALAAMSTNAVLQDSHSLTEPDAGKLGQA